MLAYIPTKHGFWTSNKYLHTDFFVLMKVEYVNDHLSLGYQMNDFYHMAITQKFLSKQGYW